MTRTRLQLVPAQPSATIILVRDSARGPELLMARRRAGDAFGDNYAFPGGVLDADEAAAGEFCGGVTAHEADAVLRIRKGGLDFYSAVIRELFEETGILLARQVDGAWVTDRPDLQELRLRVNAGQLAWSRFLREQDLRMACDAVHYFAHWETPLDRPKRWSARFFIAEPPPGQDATHDGSELTDIRWLTAGEALSAGQDGGMKLPFPTIRTLQALAECNSVELMLEWAQSRAREGVIKMRPVEASYDGKKQFVVPGDPGYPEGGDGEE